ncbi:IRK-interacting protein-like [Zingiber officinale]|uniref:IRK-interacting protein-like n=1 Tax=Zingiber officinale TaxID=94328 RepID=UPI001C4DC022|nr:IRK-interacting protein-like [Zingiber officinale]
MKVKSLRAALITRAVKQSHAILQIKKKKEKQKGKPSAMASPSSSSLRLPPRSSFTPIPEHDKEEDDEKEEQQVRATSKDPPRAESRIPTPLHGGAARRPPRPKTGHLSDEAVAVSCNNCRPTSRDKLIVPIDPSASTTSSASPGGILRSLFFSLTRRSPASAASSASAAADVRDDRWRLVAAELSRKILHVTRKRDEALLEASRLKYALAELERKVDLLESNIRSISHPSVRPVAFSSRAFCLAVEEARTAVRHFARLLIAQIRLVRRSVDRVAGLIQPLDPRASVEWRRNPACLLVYMEALLNRLFYSRLEEGDEEESGLIDPAARCESNRAGYEAVRGLSWEDVLSKGTRHHSEGLSRFCDLKMSEVVAMVGWTTQARAAWPEGLLQAFFGAAKGAWVVRLMARSVHPAVPALRAERGARFDGRFMDDVAEGRVRRLTPASVREMVAPGFDLYMEKDGVVKCRVVCEYCSNSDGERRNVDEKQGSRSGRSETVDSFNYVR